MNTKLALTAIAMFAVIMGVSSIAPAIAAPGNPTSKATTEICHFAEAEPIFDDAGVQIGEEPAHWMFLFVSNKGALNGHLKHGEDTDGDGIVDILDFILDENTPGNTRSDCDALVNQVP